MGFVYIYLVVSLAFSVYVQANAEGGTRIQTPELVARGGRIVGGVPMAPNEWPFLVLITGDDGYYTTFCGGSILDASTVLSAAHCYDGKENWNWNVTAGNGTQTQSVSEIRLHANYSGEPDYTNDIAILKLAQPLQIQTGIVEVVQLNSDASCPADGATCTVAGWGATSENGESSDIPLKVDVTVVNSNTCDQAYGEIGPEKLCAADSGKDSCQGDSGGPFACQCGGSLKQVGIVSYGRGCARPGYPGVYARVSCYTNWIQQNRN